MKMTSLKRLLLTTLCIIIVFSLSACGGGGSTKTAPPSPSPTQEATAAPTATPEPEKIEMTTLKVIIYETPVILFSYPTDSNYKEISSSEAYQDGKVITDGIFTIYFGLDAQRIAEDGGSRFSTFDERIEYLKADSGNKEDIFTPVEYAGMSGYLHKDMASIMRLYFPLEDELQKDPDAPRHIKINVSLPTDGPLQDDDLKRIDTELTEFYESEEVQMILNSLVVRKAEPGDLDVVPNADGVVLKGDKGDGPATLDHAFATLDVPEGYTYEVDFADDSLLSIELRDEGGWIAVELDVRNVSNSSDSSKTQEAMTKVALSAAADATDEGDIVIGDYTYRKINYPSGSKRVRYQRYSPETDRTIDITLSTQLNPDFPSNPEIVEMLNNIVYKD